MTQVRSVSTVLTGWLATDAPEVFTHGDARKAIEILRDEALREAERSELSLLLARFVSGGWLQRTNVQGDSTKRNFYNIRKRPVATSEEPTRIRQRSSRDVAVALLRGVLALDARDKLEHDGASDEYWVLVVDLLPFTGRQLPGGLTMSQLVEEPVTLEELKRIQTGFWGAMNELKRNHVLYAKNKTNEPIGTLGGARTALFTSKVALREMRQFAGDLDAYFSKLATWARNDRA